MFWAITWGEASKEAETAQKKKAALRRPVPAKRTESVYRKHEHAVPALEVELRVAAATHRDVLAVAGRVGDRPGVRARAAVEAPEPLPRRGVERGEAAASLPPEEKNPRPFAPPP